MHRLAWRPRKTTAARNVTLRLTDTALPFGLRFFIDSVTLKRR
jgi:hypothetical protein